MGIVQSAREISYAQRERVVEKLLRELKILKGATIGLLGLAFKPNTDALRDAPAVDIAARLLQGGATCGSMIQSRSAKLVASAQNPLSKSMIPGSAWPQMQTR